MSFSVPAEYEQFVSSTEELLSQFGQSTSATGIISYSIHCPNCLLRDVLNLRENVMRVVEPLMSGYLWHNERFDLVVQADVHAGTVLRGLTRIGDCVDDEWFIVFLLIIISKHNPDVSIAVDDADGQFLLMEGADHIPDWLGPENVENRVWLRAGRFHIIPIDEPGRSKSGGMVLEKALQCILKPNGCNQAAIASNPFHQAIFNRTTEVYPAKIKANDHFALCILPDWLAKILEGNPGVVARAVDSFHCTDQDVMRKYCAASSFGPASKGRALAADQLRAVTVRMTRVMYAQLTFKNFRPPRKYHSLQRRVALASSRKVNQAFDVGCRLACGLECAYQNSLEHSSKVAGKTGEPADLQGSAQWAELLRVAEASHYPLSDAHELQRLQSDFQQNLIMSAANFDRYARRDGAYPQGFHRFVDSRMREIDAADTVPAVADDAALEAADQAVFRSVVDGSVRGDEEAWLYMSPEELDKEMEARVRSFGGTGGSIGSNGPVAAGLAEDLSAHVPADASAEAGNQTSSSEEAEDRAAAANLQSMVDGIKNFMQGSSDIDGISVHKAARTKATKEKKEPALPQVIAEDCSSEKVPLSPSTGLELDLGYLDSLLRGAPHALPSAAPSQDAVGGGSTGQADKAAEERTAVEAADLAGYFSREDLEEFASDEGQDSDDSDLDEEDDLQGAQAADAFLEGVLNNGTAADTTARTPQQQGERAACGGGAGGAGGAGGVGAAVLGTGTGYLSPAGAGSRRSVTGPAALDSDDEVEDGAPEEDEYGDVDAESEGSEDSQDALSAESIKEFQRMMDLELFGQSSLSETFEWAQQGGLGAATGAGAEDDDRDVDVDLTLLKNLMEAQAQGMGSPLAGPLGQLMAQLGINMPVPPPMKGKPKNN